MNFYLEPLTTDEITFLKNKLQKENKQFFKGVLFVMGMFVLIGIISGVLVYFSEQKKLEEQPLLAEIEPPVSMLSYSLLMLGVMLFFLFFIYLFHQKNYRKQYKDLKSGQKIVQQTRIASKRFMPHDNSFHFYLKDAYLLSIPVSEEDYKRYEIEDEINIEIASDSHFLLGYF